MMIQDFMIKFMQINNYCRDDHRYLAMQIDRETSYIKRIFDDDMTLNEVIGSPHSLSFQCLPKIFRIQQVPLNSETFAFIQIMTDNKQRFGEQFVLPLEESMTFNDLAAAIEESLLHICNKSEFKLMKMKFEQKVNKYGQPFINYKAPKLDFEIDLQINGEYLIGPIFKD